MFSVASIKDRLRIRAGDESKDQILLGIAAAVRRYTEDRTGFEVDAAEAARVDLLRNACSGRPLLLSRRPIGAIASVQSAIPAQTLTWTSREYMLLDAQEGMIQLLGLNDGADSFPPTRGLAPYERWRKSRWPLVRVTYSTTLLDPLPEDLELAMIDLAVFYYRRGQNSNLVSSGMGDLNELYNDRAIPLHVAGLFAPYDRKAVQWA